MNIAIIPARGGSTRVPRKNIRPFHGRPIIAYSIEIARASRLFDEIVVSTDDQDIVAVVKAASAKVHMRPARLCQNEIGTQEVTKAALEWWQVCHPEDELGLAACIYATAPLMSAKDLQRGRAALEASGMAYAYACGHTEEGLIDAGQWYLGAARAFLEGVALTDATTVRLILPPWQVCDINTEDDWRRALAMYQKLQERRLEEEQHQ